MIPVFLSLFLFFLILFVLFSLQKIVPKTLEILERSLLITGSFDVVLTAWFTDVENYTYHWHSCKPLLTP